MKQVPRSIEELETAFQDLSKFHHPGNYPRCVDKGSSTPTQFSSLLRPWCPKCYDVSKAPKSYFDWVKAELEK